jgi:hypothetical protein
MLSATVPSAVTAWTGSPTAKRSGRHLAPAMAGVDGTRLSTGRARPLAFGPAVFNTVACADAVSNITGPSSWSPPV